MRNTGPVSASLIICESVLTEKTGVVSAIRIMDVLTVPALGVQARFFVLTYLHSRPADYLQHVLRIQMVGQDGSDWKIVADAPDHRFVYGYALAALAPGGFVLTTEFNINLIPLGSLGTYLVQAIVDGDLVEQTPLTLQRLG
jgi:hypothetical protein